MKVTKSEIRRIIAEELAAFEENSLSGDKISSSKSKLRKMVPDASGVTLDDEDVYRLLKVFGDKLDNHEGRLKAANLEEGTEEAMAIMQALAQMGANFSPAVLGALLAPKALEMLKTLTSNTDDKDEISELDRIIDEEIATMTNEGFFSNLGQSLKSLGKVASAGASPGGQLKSDYVAAYERCKYNHKVDGASDDVDDYPSTDAYLRKCYKQLMSTKPGEADIIASAIVKFRKWREEQAQ